MEEPETSTSDDLWSPQYNILGDDIHKNPERPYSPQYLDCSLCNKRGSLYAVKGIVQRIILAIGLFLCGRVHDLPIIELVREKQFLDGPQYRDWKKVSIHVDMMITVGRKLKSIYIESKSIGSRIIHALCPQLDVLTPVEIGSLETAIEFFIEIFTDDLDKIRRRGNETINNFLNEKDEYDFYRVLKEKDDKRLEQCLLCGRVADKETLVTLKRNGVETFALGIYASPLVSNLMTADQAYWAARVRQVYVCEEHTHEMAKWLKLFIENNLHDKKTMKAFDDATDLMKMDSSLLKGIQALHSFISKYIPPDPRLPQICHYCKKEAPNVFYDELFCLSAHHCCHRENAKHILAKLKSNNLEELEQTPPEMLYIAYDKLVHFLPIVTQRKAEKRQMNTNEMKILLYVLMARYFDPNLTNTVEAKKDRDPSLYYGERPAPYSPPTSLPKLPQETIRFVKPDEGWCPTEVRLYDYPKHIMKLPMDKWPPTCYEVAEMNRRREKRKEEIEKRQKEKEERAQIKYFSQFFTKEYLAKVDKMQAEEKARKLAEQTAGTSQNEDERMEVDDGQTPSTSEAARNVNWLEDSTQQAMETEEPHLSGKSEHSHSQSDFGDQTQPKIRKTTESVGTSNTTSDSGSGVNEITSTPSQSQQFDSQISDSSKSGSDSSDRRSEQKILQSEAETDHFKRDTKQTPLEETNPGLPHSKASSSSTESLKLSSSSTKKTEQKEKSKEVESRKSEFSEKRKTSDSESDEKLSKSEPGTSDSYVRISKNKEADKSRPTKSEPFGNRTEKLKDPSSTESKSFKVPAVPSSKKPSTSALPPQSSNEPPNFVPKHNKLSKESNSSGAMKRSSRDMESGPVAKKSEVGSSGPQTNVQSRSDGRDRSPFGNSSKQSSSSRTPSTSGDVGKALTSKQLELFNELSTPGSKHSGTSSSQFGSRSGSGSKPAGIEKSNEKKRQHEKDSQKNQKQKLLSDSSAREKSVDQKQSSSSSMSQGSSSSIFASEKPLDLHKQSQSNAQQKQEKMVQQQKKSLSREKTSSQTDLVDPSMNSKQGAINTGTSSLQPENPPEQQQFPAQQKQGKMVQQQKQKGQSNQPSLSRPKEQTSSQVHHVDPPAISGTSVTSSEHSPHQPRNLSGQTLNRTCEQREQSHQDEQKQQPNQASLSHSGSIPTAPVPIQSRPVHSIPGSAKIEDVPSQKGEACKVPAMRPKTTAQVKHIPTTHPGPSKIQHGQRAQSGSRQSSNLKILTGLSQSTPSLAPSTSAARKSIPSLMDIDPTARLSIPSLMDTQLAPLRPGTSPTPLGSVRSTSGPIPAPISSLLGSAPSINMPGPAPLIPGLPPLIYQHGSMPPAPGSMQFGAPGLMGAAPAPMQYGEPGLMPPGVNPMQYGAGIVRQGSRPPNRMLQPWEVKPEPRDTGYPDARNARNAPGTSQRIQSHRHEPNSVSNAHHRNSAASASLERSNVLPPPPPAPLLTPVVPASGRSTSASNRMFQMKDLKRELPSAVHSDARQKNQPSGSSQKISQGDQRSKQGIQRPTSSQPTSQARQSQQSSAPGKKSVPTTSRANPMYKRSSFAKELSAEEIAANRLRHQGIVSSIPVSSNTSTNTKQQQPSTSSANSNISKPGTLTKSTKELPSKNQQVSRQTAPLPPPPAPPSPALTKIKTPAEIKQEIYDDMNQPH